MGKGCDYYEQASYYCTGAKNWANSEGVSALDACCTCNGGYQDSTVTSSPTPSKGKGGKKKGGKSGKKKGGKGGKKTATVMKMNGAITTEE